MQDEGRFGFLTPHDKIGVGFLAFPERYKPIVNADLEGRVSASQSRTTLLFYFKKM